ncbi:MAG TPA: hypothetical protein VL495_00060 [Edaphobacter sp.]|jgi:hypothetical protein|nr:hypothetical protein [Edaphobacter sp.]
MAAAAAEGIHRIVVRYEDRTVCGTVKISDLGTIDQILHNDPHAPLETIKLTLCDTGEEEELPTQEAKAVFFVKTFEGDLRHKALHFHENSPIVPGLWVRVYFYDGEMIEGIIRNTREFVLENGFFLIPTDPNGNNRLAYVNKRGLKDFHILGMRNMPKNLHKL